MPTYVLLFSVATAVAILVRPLRIPYTVALVFAGLGLGALPGFVAPQLTRDLLFAVFLPGLLFEAAFHLSARAFWRNRLAILSLAVPGVLASIALIAAVLVPAGVFATATDRGVGAAIVFAALIAATDPIAVVAVFRSLGAPQRLTVLVEGESLLNDGTAVVFFTLALAWAAGGAMSAAALVGDFFRMTVGGALIGLVVATAISIVMRRIDDPLIEITLTVLAAYGSFSAAESLQVSGVIATVAAGMICGNYAAERAMSQSTRVAVTAFWEYVAFALNSLVFLLLGVQVGTTGLLSAWKPILIAFAAVVIARIVLLALVRLSLLKTRERFPRRWSPILALGGIRGALSMVLALSVPTTLAGRDLIIAVTFGVVLLTIVIQGLAVGPVLRASGICDEESVQR